MSSLTAPDVLAADLLVSSFYNNQLLRYDQQTGSFITTFAKNAALEQPVGMVFGPDGNLYVAGQTSENVVRFNGQTGEFIDEFVTPDSGGLFLPIFLIFGPDGNLYVTSFTEQILRYDGQTGDFIDVFAEGGGLDAKLEAAQKSIEDLKQNNDVSAKKALEAFINSVAAQRGGKIPEMDADMFIADTKEIIDLLNGS